MWHDSHKWVKTDPKLNSWLTWSYVGMLCTDFQIQSWRQPHKNEIATAISRLSNDVTLGKAPEEGVHCKIELPKLALVVYVP